MTLDGHEDWVRTGAAAGICAANQMILINLNESQS
jgi:hypothetical protein